MAGKNRKQREYTEREKIVLAAGKTPIMYYKKDEKELSRVIKNFNQKITRAAKKNPGDANLLPEKMTKKQFKAMVDTRDDFKRELEYLKNFSDRGAEKIVTIPDTDNNLKITKWQMETMEDRAKVVNKEREKRRKKIAKLEITDRGKKTGYKKGDYGLKKLDEIALSPIKPFYKSMDRTNLNRRNQNLVRESKDMYWSQKEMELRERYIETLENNFNKNDVADIVRSIRSMSYDEFYKIFMAEGGNFDEMYPGDEEETRKYLNALRARWVPHHRIRQVGEDVNIVRGKTPVSIKKGRKEE